MDSAADQFFPSHHKFGLFRSQAWQNAWREHWGQSSALTPLAKTQEQPEFYRYWHVKRGIIPIRTVIPAGISSLAAPSTRSEYFCFPRAGINASSDVRRYLKPALNYRWDLLYLPDVLEGTDEHHALLEVAQDLNLYVSEQERETAYAVDLRDHNFDDYVANLGKNTRLKLYNRRKKLAKEGEVKVENVWPDRERFYQLLNDFHRERWGKPVYEGRSLGFIETLLTGLADEGHTVDLSVMSLSGKPISAVLDLTIHGRCYNLQSGFVEDLIKGVSLGTLHLGYQIEAAFNSETEFYDLMAGSGKNSQYKAALATCQRDFVSLILVRNPALKLAYKLRDRRTMSTSHSTERPQPCSSE
ncbi:GNAT family N-acetyltransferase [Marinimicrobium sp. ABcell2]|uniref:GNAT family N-acetyltransferase n=1 Tax=Marinimicrobium sp. ABcell2 TaxID=3069751 RepID=UPI0027B731A9|nr:GNAT family N-acetyltransferase [Marinimicrobium sp. ABcell2]MDQ2076160.1 GNAT family N-acetyltransferase [Marinimicrobium sp. ABcell2]